jgi:hypothetical protein
VLILVYSFLEKENIKMQKACEKYVSQYALDNMVKNYVEGIMKCLEKKA